MTLEMREITKRFGTTTALESVDFRVISGSVHALLGENGAGKTTLMRIAFGLVAADVGELRVFGTAVDRHSVRGAIDAGVGMVHQHLSLVPTLSAAENLALGGRGRFRIRDHEALLTRTSEASGLRIPADLRVRDLSIVEQQRLEIVKALARGARLLILDEPTAVLAPAEIDDLLRWIRQFAERGGSVVLVTHKLREALSVADEVTVLRRGRVVYSRRAHATSEHELARSMFPDPVDSETPTAPHAAGAAAVEANDIGIVDARGVQRIRGATFSLHRHEVIGLAAVEGSGHRELIAALAGLATVSGSLKLPPRVGLIPSDRLREALIPEFSLTENVALRQLGRQRGLMPWSSIAARTAALMQRFNITAASADAPSRSMSGGNQQRLVIARELEHEIDLLIADNPTRGLDIRATAFVHSQLREAARRGAVVVVHSSDLDEVISLASRVLVVFHGDVRSMAPDRAAVGRAMLGAA